MKFMNQAARNWDNSYRDEAGDGSDGSGGGDGDGSSEGDGDSSDGADGSGDGDDDNDGDGGDASGSDDWRSEYLVDTDPDGNKIDAKELKKRENILKRFTDKNQFTKSYFDLHSKVRSNQPAKLPDNATEEQIAEYRKAQGLPEKAEDYTYTLPEGLVLSDDDKAITDGLKETFLDAGISPEASSKIIAANMELREKQMVARTNRDNMLVEKSIESLTERWGDDYEANMNVINNMFNGLSGGDDPEGAAMQLQNARSPNGDRIFDNPDMMAFFANVGRKANPESTLSSGDGQGSLGGRLQELETKMESGSLSSEERNEYARLLDMKEGRSSDN